MNEGVRLPRTLVNDLLHQAQSRSGEEVCGLIGERGGEPASLYPVNNVAADRARLFEMEPQAQIAAMKQMREAGEELFAIYHSHPDAPALPSPLDIEQADYPDALYLIISLNTKGVLEMRGFRIAGGAATEIAIGI